MFSWMLVRSLSKKDFTHFFDGRKKQTGLGRFSFLAYQTTKADDRELHISTKCTRVCFLNETFYVVSITEYFNFVFTTNYVSHWLLTRFYEYTKWCFNFTMFFKWNAIIWRKFDGGLLLYSSFAVEKMRMNFICVRYSRS